MQNNTHTHTHTHTYTHTTFPSRTLTTTMPEDNIKKKRRKYRPKFRFDIFFLASFEFHESFLKLNLNPDLSLS